MATVQDLATFRRRIGDRTKATKDTITANGTDEMFDLRYNNVFGLTVKVDNVDQPMDGSIYTFDSPSGRVTFLTAPQNNKVLEFVYSYAAYTDAEATSLIDEFGLARAVIEAIRELLADAARLSDYIQGPTQVKRSQVFTQLDKLLTRYENGGTTGAGSISIGKRTNPVYRRDIHEPIDITRTDEELLH